ncbi:site-2 protease family protein [Candidatus Kaiserbacteria bacterium]|nr:MAG: site-2 protease family protein [Candidatus Kaiserbacteria bacterium]
MGADILFLIAILIVSVVIHEVSHGFVANWLGDPTARLEGRLTLNPVSHIDPMGSIVLPAILALSSSPFLFGWAKPVPYNPYNLQRGGRWAEALVAGAGPAANVLIALLFSVLIRLDVLPAAAASLAVSIVFLNILLALFNLLPIPPLDGSKVFPQLLPPSLAFQYHRLRMVLEQNLFLGFGVVIVFILLFGSWLASLITVITRFLIGA